MERETRGRPAGIRTYMLVCIGASLTMVLSQYDYNLLHTVLSEQADSAGAKIDVSRIGCEVINGIGFLGAGTIPINRRHEIKGLTTAAGLWVSGCLGLAVGCGFYEVAAESFIFILLSVTVFRRFEEWLRKRLRTMSLYVEFDELPDLVDIVRVLENQHVTVKDLDFIGGGGKKKDAVSGTIFLLALPDRTKHIDILGEVSDLMCVRRVEEL